MPFHKSHSFMVLKHKSLRRGVANTVEAPSSPTYSLHSVWVLGRPPEKGVTFNAATDV